MVEFSVILLLIKVKIFARIQNGICIDVTACDVDNPAPSGDGWLEVTNEELQLLPKAAKQTTRTVLDRLTLVELTALQAAQTASPLVWAWINKAVTEGAIANTDSDFITARTFLDVNNIIAEDRWAALLAP